MYLQIKHKTQSKDPRFGRGPNQSCRSTTRSYSTRPRTREIDSCWLKASKVWYILHYSHEAGCASFWRSGGLLLWMTINPYTNTCSAQAYKIFKAYPPWQGRYVLPQNPQCSGNKFLLTF